MAVTPVLEQVRRWREGSLWSAALHGGQALRAELVMAAQPVTVSDFRDPGICWNCRITVEMDEGPDVRGHHICPNCGARTCHSEGPDWAPPK